MRTSTIVFKAFWMPQAGLVEHRSAGVAGQGQMGNVGQCVLDELKRRDVLAVSTK
jgi:hypothetical protein